MSYFLWVEDFENSPKVTASNVLGSVFDDSLFLEDKRALKKNLKNQGVFIELSLQDGLGFITPDLDKKIDYIILDIDLPAHSGDGVNTEVMGLLETFENYQKLADEVEDEALLKEKCNKLKERAGFYLYTKLVVELGFPKQHILFCSNHAENNKTILDAFVIAKMASPQIYQKSNPDVQDWVKSRYENPYSRLRRGIIEGCQYLKGLPEDKLRFNDFIKDAEKSVSLEDIRDYLGVLENFLPLREPNDKAALYKLFIRTLVHEWEAAEPKNIKGLAWIMKSTRNWITHNSTLFNALDETMLAYLFLINMRVMFGFDDAVQPYEKILLNLFAEDVLSEQLFKDKSKNKLIPISEAYCGIKNIALDNNAKDAFLFSVIANNIQEGNSPARNDKKLFTKLLYQMFWLINSYPRVDTKNKKLLEINFSDFYYVEKTYLFELARHIYSRSFS